jgi:SAM-dependent methyltransferase
MTCELAQAPGAVCPGCSGTSIAMVYRVTGAPVHSVLLFRTREEACSFPRGAIDLGLCASCGFMFNIAYSETMMEYSSRYEETQGFSPTFNEFQTRLAEDLVKRFDLHGKRILEIGCGKGEFLRLVCALGGNSGIGFDPVYVPERDPGDGGGNVRFVRDFYSEEYDREEADFVICKMTLEHIPNTARFTGMLHRSLVNNPEAVVFVQVPDMMRILRERAFWDIYYEHCSYFTAGSLGRLFHGTGFRVVDIWTDFGDQYLMLTASAGGNGREFPLPEEKATLANLSRRFGREVEAGLDVWRARLRALHAKGRKIVVWGASSKGVAFLTKADETGAVEYVVDVNPYKHGTYLPGTGQKIVGPADLQAYRPDVVIIMNPIYRREILSALESMGLSPELLELV